MSGGVAAAGRAGSYFHNYQPSYSGVSSVYGSGMQTPAQYMASSYSSPSYVGPYDRSVRVFDITVLILSCLFKVGFTLYSF